MASFLIKTPSVFIDEGSSGLMTCAIGNGVGHGTTGTSNVIIGSGAGTNITSGSNNVVIGAGANIPAGSFYNTVIGGGATITNGVSGAVAIGYLATSDKSGACVFGGPPSSGAAVSIQDSGGRMYYTANDDTLFDGVSSITLTGDQLFDGIILAQNVSSSDVNMYFPSAADIIGQLPNPVAGASFYTKVVNDELSAGNLIPKDSSDGTTTYIGLTELRPGQSGIMLVYVTNVTPGSQSVIVYN